MSDAKLTGFSGVTETPLFSAWYVEDELESIDGKIDTGFEG